MRRLLIPALTKWVDNDRGMVWGMALAFAIRLVLVPWFSDPFNFYGYHLMASLVSQGANPWEVIASDTALAELNPWGYPPLYLVPAFFASLLSFGNGFVFGLLIKLPFVFADLATGVFLFRTARSLQLPPNTARAISFGYLLNPFTIFVSAIWGANDSLAVLCTMGAFCYFLRTPSSGRMSSILLGLGIALKVYPVAFLPVFLAGLPSWRARFSFLSAAVAVAAASALPVLVASPVELLRTIVGFSTGVDPSGFDPALSFWWVLETGGISLTAAMVFAASLAFLLALVVLARFVATRRLSFVRAATIAILGLFIVAPRLNQNYFLWAVPFISLVARGEAWHPWGRRVAEFSWVPLVSTAILYNGAGGVIGISYWTLVSLGRGTVPSVGVPGWPLAVLLGVFVGFLVMSIATLLIGPGPGAEGPRPVPRSTVFREWPPRTPGSLGIVVVALVIFVSSTVAIGLRHHPVWPEDLGSYQVTPTRVIVSDEFRALVARGDWRFGGTGEVTLSPTAGHRLVLDTIRPNGTVWLERLLPNREIRLALSLVALRVDESPGLLMLARLPAGWLALQTPPSASPRMMYFDELRNFSSQLGSVSVGSPILLSIALFLDRTEVTFAGRTHVASGGAPIERIEIGHTDPIALGGGRIALERIEISWSVPSDARSPLLGSSVIVVGLALLAAPALVSRHERGNRGIA